MFELPDSKRVRREELFDDEEVAAGHEVSLNDEAENELRQKLNAQLSELLDFGLPAAGPTTQQTEPAETAEVDAAATAEEPDELAFEFRLFRDEAPTHTVVIDQNDDRLDARGGGAFVVPKRPSSYYIAGAPDPGSMEKFRFAAVTADYLFADAKQRRWGLEKPWRVTHISITARPSGKSSSTSTTDDVQMTDAKRTRPGKKRRIILRTREKAKKEKEEAARKHLESKEEHLKAKKQRLNREKKLKRRAKEKAKKSATGDAGKDGDDVSVGDSEA